MIQSRSEFEAVLGDMIRTLGKVIYARGSDIKLQGARRQLKAVEDSLKKKQVPDPEEVKGLIEAAQTIRNQKLGYRGIEERTFDLEDYLEFNPTAGFNPPKDDGGSED